jgi:transposase
MEKRLPLPQVVLQYGVSRSALESWIRTVKANGYASLHQQKKRGRPSTSMGRPKKHVPETALEKLQAENVLLKKVKALVEERAARERMSGQQPSKD